MVLHDAEPREQSVAVPRDDGEDEVGVQARVLHVVGGLLEGISVNDEVVRVMPTSDALNTKRREWATSTTVNQEPTLPP